MLSRISAYADRSNHDSETSGIDRLIHRWARARVCSTRAQAACGADQARSTPMGTAAGFDWHAPLYERPRSLKDIRFMHDPAHDDRHASLAPEADAFRWRRHPALLRMQEAPALPQAERDARKAAVCGVLAARDGDLERAAHFFAKAASEPSIRFQVVPGFWSCTRGGMDAAVAAYEQAGRFRDAAALAATIRTRYRPRVVAEASPAPDSGLLHRSSRDEAAAGTGD